jgi:hypothetical protein
LHDRKGHRARLRTALLESATFPIFETLLDLAGDRPAGLRHHFRRNFNPCSMDFSEIDSKKILFSASTKG